MSLFSSKIGSIKKRFKSLRKKRRAETEGSDNSGYGKRKAMRKKRKASRKRVRDTRVRSRKAESGTSSADKGASKSTY